MIRSTNWFGGLISIFSVLALVLSSGCGTEHLFDRGELSPLTPSTDNGPPSFASDVMPAFSACISCHSGGAGGWVYDGGVDAYDQVLSRTDLDDPASSLILQKGSGAVSHAGGVHFSVGNATYELILTWIEDGAEDN